MEGAWLSEERARRERAERMARILGASSLPAAEGAAVLGVPDVADPARGRFGHRDGGDAGEEGGSRAFVRAEAEDDDGYDPYSDRPAPAEPLYEADPWA